MACVWCRVTLAMIASARDGRTVKLEPLAV
jgi:hypothetical protein